LNITRNFNENKAIQMDLDNFINLIIECRTIRLWFHHLRSPTAKRRVTRVKVRLAREKYRLRHGTGFEDEE